MARYMEFWVKQWRDDPVLNALLQSKAMQRLKDISFLGAIDYTSLVEAESEGDRSRWTHSLAVAAVTDFVAQSRRYNEETRRHLVAAALLHDIGHAPLSHSVEPFFKQHLGLGHHDLGHYFMDEDEELASLLKDHFDVDRIKHLIAGDVGFAYGDDLFSGPINVDTIDGILRSAKRFKEKIAYSPFELAEAAFLESDQESSTALLDQFWELKGRMYEQYIVSETGILADAYSQFYFENQSVSLSQGELVSTEREWRHAYPELFHGLETLSEYKDGDALEGRGAAYVSRCYYVVPSEKNHHARYQVKKYKKEIHFGLSANKHKEGMRDGIHRKESCLYQ